MTQGNLVAAAATPDRPVAPQPRRESTGPAKAAPEAQVVADFSPQSLSGLCASGAPGIGRLPMLDAVLAGLPQFLIERFKKVWKLEIVVDPEPVVFDRYETQIARYCDAGLFGLFTAQDVASNGILVIDPELVFLLLDGLLGARRSGAAEAGPARAFTLIETGLMQLVARQVLAGFAASLQQVVPLELAFHAWEKEPRRVRPAVEGEQVLVLRLSISFASRTGWMTIILPISLFEPVRPQLEAVFPGEKFGHDTLWSTHLAHEVAQAEVGIAAVLYEAMVPLGRVRMLMAGDTFSFELPPDADVELRCNGMPVSNGRMGRAGERVAIQVGSPFATLHQGIGS